MTPFLVFVTPFPNIVFNNARAINRISPRLTSFQNRLPNNEGTIGAINEAAIAAIKVASIPPPCFVLSSLTVSVTQSFNRPDFSSDFTILLKLSISSFEMSKVNLFPSVTFLAPAPHSPIFLSKLFIIEEVALDGNFGNIS